MLREYHHLLFFQPKFGTMMLSHGRTYLIIHKLESIGYLIKCALVILGWVRRTYLKITI